MLHVHPPSGPRPHTHTHTHYPSPPLVSVSTAEWVTLLFTIFPIPSQVFGLAGRPAFSLAITGLWGFSNGAFEEITLFSPSSGEKPETFGPRLVQSITQTALRLYLTHLATKISSNVVCRGIRGTCTHLAAFVSETRCHLCGEIGSFDRKIN